MRSLLNTISTGFQHDDKPVIPERSKRGSF